MLSFRSLNGAIQVRAHRMFLEAPEEVVGAVGRMVRGDRRGRPAVQAFIRTRHDRIRPHERQARRVHLRTRGRHHDLAEIRAVLNATLLENRSQAPVTWGREVRRARARSVRLGWYDERRNLIGLSRRLDAADVPRYFVEYVMFHEMLHEVLGIRERPDGRREIHGRTFKFLEQTCPDFERARAFEKRKWR